MDLVITQNCFSGSHGILGTWPNWTISRHPLDSAATAQIKGDPFCSCMMVILGVLLPNTVQLLGCYTVILFLFF